MSDADPPKPVTKRPRPKYQVFVSSTYDDLHDERREATWEILKVGHIPAGMENFTATDERGWQIIRRTIDRSDYYVVLVADRHPGDHRGCHVRHAPARLVVLTPAI